MPYIHRTIPALLLKSVDERADRRSHIISGSDVQSEVSRREQLSQVVENVDRSGEVSWFGVLRRIYDVRRVDRVRRIDRVCRIDGMSRSLLLSFSPCTFS